MGHMGRHFGRHMGWHFGGRRSGIGPAGSTTIALDVEHGAMVTYEWQTDVMKAWSGLEQRMGLLGKPRQRYELDVKLSDAQYRRILSHLAGSAHQGPLFQLGLAYEEFILSEDATATTLTFESLASCDWNEPGQRIVVVHPETGATMDAVVQSSAGASITVDIDVTAVAVAGARVMPAMGVYLDPDQNVDRYRVRLGTWSIRTRAARFRFGYAGEPGKGATVNSYDGFPVWDVGVNTDTLRPESILTGVDVVDLGSSIAAIQAYGRPDWRRQIRIESSATEAWQWFKKFLDTVNGRRVAFLLPTGRPDLVPIGDASTGTLVIASTENDYVADWWPSVAHRRLRILLADGTSAYRTVDAATDNGNGTQDLTLDSSLAGTIDRVEFLETVRLDTDRISVGWQGVTFESAFDVRVVQHEAEDAPAGYDEHEESRQDGKPIDLYTLVLSGRIYRLTSAEEDLILGGNAYHATPGLGRGQLTLRQVGSIRKLEVTLARNHAAAVVLMSNGIPPRVATLQLHRFHRGDTEARLQWSGSVSQVRVEGPYLRLLVPNDADVALNAKLPFAAISRTCQHMLYGPGCEVDRDYPTFDNHEHMSVAAAVSQTGAELEVSELVTALSVARPNQWARFGEVRRVVDGERRSILDQTGTTLTLDRPFAYMVAGDDLEIYAGCDWAITTCRDKFSNNQRFGGHPDAPDFNPMNIQDDD